MSLAAFPILVIEKRHNDFEYINLQSLNIFDNANYSSLETFDNLIIKFSEEDLRNAIITANIVVNNDVVLASPLYVKYGNFKLPVMTKEVVSSLNLPKFILDNIKNKRYANIFYNKLTSILDNDLVLKELKTPLDQGDFKGFMSVFSKLDYVNIREFYFYIYNNILPKMNEEEILSKKRELQDD